MGQNILKSQFSGGEIAPSLYARVETGVYQTGAAKIQNFFVEPQGGLSKRAGTEFIGNCPIDQASPEIRLIPFQFSQQDSYALEFSHLLMRVIRQGGYVLATEDVGGVQTLIERPIQSIPTGADPTFTTTIAHGFAVGNHVQFASVTGMTGLNGRIFVVKSVATSTTFKVKNFDQTNINSIAFGGDFTTGVDTGKVRKIFSLSTSYLGSELAALNFDQSADVMTLTHPNHVQAYLKRFDHAFWTLKDVEFAASIASPVSVTGLTTHNVSVSIDAVTKEAVGRISLADASSSFARGSAGFIRGTGGMSQINDTLIVLGTLTNPTTKTYEMRTEKLEAIDTTGYTTYTSGGTLSGDTVYRYVVTSVAEDGSESRPSTPFVTTSKAMSALVDAGKPYPKILIQWTSVAGAVSYNVYRQKEVPSGAPEVGSLYGYVGRSTTTQFTDQNITPDFTLTPPSEYNPFLQTVVSTEITGITKANPAVITTALPHGLVVNDIVLLRDIGGMTQMDDLKAVVATVPTSTTFTVKVNGVNVNSTSYSPFSVSISAISKANPVVVTTSTAHTFKVGDPVFVDGVSGMVQMNGLQGLVKSVTSTTMTLYNLSTNEAVDSTGYTTYTSGGTVRGYLGYVDRRNPKNKPVATCYYQQRKVYAGSNEAPQNVWMSQTGSPNSMDKSVPVKDDDSIEFRVDSIESNQIRHVIPLSSLLIFTEGAVFNVKGGQGNAITPSDVQAVPQVYVGANKVHPLVLGSDVIYVGAGDNTVNAIGFTYLSDSYEAEDISVRSAHLIQKSKIKEWCRVQSPNNYIVAVRDDGKLLFITYLKKVGVTAWSWGDTGESTLDAFESVCSIREGGEDVVYAAVKRYITVGENTAYLMKYIERFATRNLYKDGKSINENALFSDCSLRYVGAPTTTPPINLRHLAGRPVVVVADGSVLEGYTGADGVFSLRRPASVITVGLPYTAELETLPIDVGNGSISGKKKSIHVIQAKMEDTRGLLMSVDGANYVIPKETPIVGGLGLPFTNGTIFYQMPPNVSRDGVMYAKHDLPLPCKILGLLPDVTITERELSK